MNASVAIQVLPNVQDEEEVIRIVDEVHQIYWSELLCRTI
jgi:uncharacterized protein YqgV (UPF0045/DUF77 family)